MSKAHKYYVLAHYRQPAFVTDGDDIPQSFATHSAACEFADDFGICKKLGYSVICWEDQQAGDGILQVYGHPRV